MTYGQRFRALRRQLWKGKGKTVLALANQLDSKYAATIYNIERQWRVPLLPTLMRHAAALGCRPWDLLVDVETEYDLVRQLADVRPEDADRQWRVLLRRYQESATRVPRSNTTGLAIARSIKKPHGAALAVVGSGDQADRVPGSAAAAALAPHLEQLTGDIEQALARRTRATRKSSAASVARTPRRDPRPRTARR